MEHELGRICSPMLVQHRWRALYCQRNCRSLSHHTFCHQKTAVQECTWRSATCRVAKKRDWQLSCPQLLGLRCYPPVNIDNGNSLDELPIKTSIYSIDEFPNKTSRNWFYVKGYWCCNIYAKGLQACWYRNRSAQKRWWFIDVDWFAVGLMIHLMLWMEEILHHLGWLKPYK